MRLNLQFSIQNEAEKLQWHMIIIDIGNIIDIGGDQGGAGLG